MTEKEDSMWYVDIVVNALGIVKKDVLKIYTPKTSGLVSCKELPYFGITLVKQLKLCDRVASSFCQFLLQTSKP